MLYSKDQQVLYTFKGEDIMRITLPNLLVESRPICSTKKTVRKNFFHPRGPIHIPKNLSCPIGLVFQNPPKICALTLVWKSVRFRFLCHQQGTFWILSHSPIDQCLCHFKTVCAYVGSVGMPFWAYSHFCHSVYTLWIVIHYTENSTGEKPTGSTM